MISQIAVIVMPGGWIDADVAGKTVGLLETLDSIGEFALPFLLIANFALILDTENGYRRKLRIDGAATIVSRISRASIGCWALRRSTG